MPSFAHTPPVSFLSLPPVPFGQKKKGSTSAVVGVPAVFGTVRHAVR
jgi:hypothetical protein